MHVPARGLAHATDIRAAINGAVRAVTSQSDAALIAKVARPARTGRRVARRLRLDSGHKEVLPRSKGPVRAISGTLAATFPRDNFAFDPKSIALPVSPE